MIVLYFVVKSAVKNGVKAAYWDITGKESPDEIEFAQMDISAQDEIDKQG